MESNSLYRSKSQQAKRRSTNENNTKRVYGKIWTNLKIHQGSERKEWYLTRRSKEKHLISIQGFFFLDSGFFIFFLGTNKNNSGMNKKTTFFFLRNMIFGWSEQSRGGNKTIDDQKMIFFLFLEVWYNNIKDRLNLDELELALIPTDANQANNVTVTLLNLLDWIRPKDPSRSDSVNPRPVAYVEARTLEWWRRHKREWKFAW